MQRRDPHQANLLERVTSRRPASSLLAGLDPTPTNAPRRRLPLAILAGAVIAGLLATIAALVPRETTPLAARVVTQVSAPAVKLFTPLVVHETVASAPTAAAPVPPAPDPVAKRMAKAATTPRQLPRKHPVPMPRPTAPDQDDTDVVLIGAVMANRNQASVKP